MIRGYIRLCKNFWRLKVNNKKYLTWLTLSYLLGNIVFLILPFLASKIIDYATLGNYQETFYLIIILAVAYFIDDLLARFAYVTFAWNNNYVYNKLQKKVIGKIAKYDVQFTNKISKAYLINTTADDIWNSCGLHNNMFDIMINLFRIFMEVAILFYINKWICLVAIISTIIYFRLLDKVIKKRDIHLKKQYSEADKIVGLASEIIDGNKEIKSFDMKEKLMKHLIKLEIPWKDAFYKKRKYYDISRVFLPYIIKIGEFLLYGIGIFCVTNKNMTIGTLMLIIMYYKDIHNTSFHMNSLYQNFSAHGVRVERIAKILEYESPDMISFGQNETDSIFGFVEFSKVNFSYENKQILKNISFKIMPNKITALVGQSGSGKSTIFRLLLRLYQLDSGKITIDGIDICEYSEKVYSSNVAIVTQKPFIFNMSIRQNLNFVDSNFDHQVEVCKKVGIHDFIMGLPKGYNTILKEDATNISGGQKQLIALARTLLSKAEILLFDEVTSSLDPNTTKQVIRVINKLKKDHTIVLITHKPQLMKSADQIIVMNQGRIVGNGIHDQLMIHNRYYKNLQK